jgi:hypothetical protein
MNYGDGVYGGIFVAALYSNAYFENDIPTIIDKALLTIPEESDYYKIIKDVETLHNQYPADWRAAWHELQNKWGEEDICGAGDNFNIDAKLNGAYIVLGLLYGEGDPVKTIEITTRCGQDSDCNPSNALAVLGVLKGFSNLPDYMKEGIMAVGDTNFINTNYSFNKAVESTYNYAIGLVKENGGEVTSKKIKIKIQEPVSPELEVSFPNVVFDRKISVLDKNAWKMNRNWNLQLKAGNKEADFHALVSGNKGYDIELTFSGTGVSITGDWVKDGGKADVFLDGKLHRTIDTYYDFSGQQHKGVSIWHVFGLQPGEHKVKILVKGGKRPESENTNVYISGATIFKTVARKNTKFKFTFEQ